jgi:hypothetical protein
MVILMVILLLLGIALAAYIKSGYAPERALKTKISDIYFIGIGERILFQIRVTPKFPKILSVVPLPWPFKHIWVSLKWAEVVEGKSKKDEKVKGTEEKKFKSIEEFETAPNLFYGSREEMVPSLRIYEPVSYLIKAKSSDMHSFYLILKMYIFVGNGMKAVERPNFKQIGEIDSQSQIAPWALKKTTRDLMDTNIQNIKDPKDGIRFQVGENENDTMDIVTYLNSKLKRLGCRVDSIALQIITGKDAEAYFEEIRKLASTQQRKINQDAQEEVRKAERLTELNDAINQAEIAKTEFETYGEPIKDFVDSIYNGEAHVAAQRQHTLVEANHESGRIGVEAIKAYMDEVSKATNKNASKQRKEEETANA